MFEPPTKDGCRWLAVRVAVGAAAFVALCVGLVLAVVAAL